MRWYALGNLIADVFFVAVCYELILRGFQQPQAALDAFGMYATLAVLLTAFLWLSTSSAIALNRVPSIFLAVFTSPGVLLVSFRGLGRGDMRGRSLRAQFFTALFLPLVISFILALCNVDLRWVAAGGVALFAAQLTNALLWPDNLPAPIAVAPKRPLRDVD